MKNMFATIELNRGNKKKQQQIGDNAIHHAKNPHVKFHFANYMIGNEVPSRFDLESVRSNAMAKISN